MRSTRSIYSCNSATDFLKQILHNDASFTILIICSTRDQFLDQLVTTINTPNETNLASHQLATKTIGLLSNCSKIKLIFCPTLETLRAYISVLRSNHAKDNVQRRPLLAIIGLLAAHLSTSEFTAQGLSRTLANVVEASSREQMDLILCECNDARSVSEGQALWDANVPLLNGSVRFGDENIWSGRGVSVKKVAQRWFDLNENT